MADYTLSAKITGDSSGFDKAIKDAEKAADNFKTKMGNIGGNLKSIGAGFENVGKKLTNTITKPAGLAATALAGITLGKGWSRMTQIDDAKVKLEAIGNSAEDVTEIMNNALVSVKGTSYGLDEAATTAASAVAAGIQPGQQLEGYLTAVADAAAVAKTDMSSMGSIFNKVTTQGKASNEILQQMAEAGIPIYQYLAETVGTSSDEIYKMASNGEIDLATFQKAVETHIGGAAKIMGSKTISGAISNLGASVSRIGANFLGSSDDANSFAGQVLPLLNDLTTWLGTVEEKAKEWGATFGQVFSAIVSYCRTGDANMSSLSDTAAGIVGKITPIIDVVKRIASAFSSLSPKMQGALGIGAVAAGPLISMLGKVMTTAGGVFKGIETLSGGLNGFASNMRLAGSNGTVLSGIMTKLASPMGLIVTIVGAVAAAFAYLMATNDGFRESVMSTVTTIISSLQPIMQTIMELLMQVGGILLNTIGNVLQQLAPVLAQIVTFIGSLVEMLAPLLNQLIGSLAPVITQIVQTISQIIQSLMPPLMAILESIMAVIQALMPPIQKILTVVINVVSKIIEGLSPIISTVGNIISKVVEIISPIVEVIAGIIAKIVEFISPLIDVFATIFGAIFDVVGAVFGAIWDVISGVFSGIESAWNGLTGFVGGIVDGIGSAFNALVDGVKSVINGVIWAINGAIWVINLIPGVNIGEIPYLAHGTDNWQGGFAYMNEGGRGELTYLPNGSQVIPHDISVQYAKEAARANASAEPVDLTGILEGLVIQVVNNTTVDGTPLKEMAAEYTIKRIGGQQRAVQRARGFA